EGEVGLSGIQRMPIESPTSARARFPHLVTAVSEASNCWPAMLVLVPLWVLVMASRPPFTFRACSAVSSSAGCCRSSICTSLFRVFLFVVMVSSPFEAQNRVLRLLCSAGGEDRRRLPPRHGAVRGDGSSAWSYRGTVGLFQKTLMTSVLRSAFCSGVLADGSPAA